MEDTKRLELLKEIGGTKVYEEKRRQAIKEMQDTEPQRHQIAEQVCLCFISGLLFA